MLEQIKATVIVDNIPKEDVLGEWGLAIYIETGSKNVLLDVGASNLFATNAEKLGKDIQAVDYAVLSHAHYDHANGMRKFLEKNEKASFYLRETAGENCYFKKVFLHKYIGIPKKVLTDYSDRITFASGDYVLCEDVYLIPHHTEGLGAIGKRESMYQRTADGWKPDDFSHEQSLVFDTKKGLVIFNSCCHGGAVNVIREVTAAFPDKQVYGLIGGFHLFNKPEKEIREVANAIKETGIQYVCTGHCTKIRAFHILKEELGDMLHQLHIGQVMEF